jgi:hypothetical protein
MLKSEDHGQFAVIDVERRGDEWADREPDVSTTLPQIWPQRVGHETLYHFYHFGRHRRNVSNAR